MNERLFRTSGAVVVGLDDRPIDDQREAITFAAAEANRRRVPILLAHGCQPLVTTTTVLPADTIADLERSGLDLLDSTAGVVRDQLDSALPIEVQLGHGTGAATLLALSDTAGVIVLQRRAVGTLRRWRTGSTTTRVAAEAHCPVAVVRGQHNDTPIGRGVVCGVDERGHASYALETAFAEASVRSAPLTAVHAWQMPDLPLTYGYIPPDDDEIAALRQQAEVDLAEALAGYSSRYPDVVVRRRLINGAPQEVLDLAAEGAELLVVGRHGSSRFPAIAVGSVALHAIRNQACPVLVVPAAHPNRHRPPPWLTGELPVGASY